MNPIIGKIIINKDVQMFLLQATKSDHKNENGAQENVHIFKSNAPTLLKLGVGLDQSIPAL